MRQSQIRDYRVEHESGDGAEGCVYLARDSSGNRLALKVLAATADRGLDAGSWRHMTQALRSIRDGHVARVLFAGTLRFEGTPCLAIATEYIEGRTVRSLIRDGSMLSAHATRRLLQDLARALGAVHAAGLLHGDVRPANAILRPDGRAVLIDFGFLCIDPAGTAAPSGRAGLARYVAPERASDESFVDGRADLFSLGITAIEAHTGVADRVTALERCAPSLRPMLSALTESDPARRPCSAAAAASALEGDMGLQRSIIGRPLAHGWCSVLAGREAELDLLGAAYAQSDPSARSALIWGAAGSGKSALLAAFSRHTQGLGRPDLEIQLAFTPGRSCELAPMLRDALIAKRLPGIPTHPASRPDAIELLEAIADQGRAIPVLLLVEDLHFAPPDVERLLSAFVEASPDSRLMIVATTRLAPTVCWDTVVPVAPLSTAEVSDMLLDAVGDPAVACALLDPVLSASDGLPLLVALLLAQLRGDGTLRRRPDGSCRLRGERPSLRLPASMEESIRLRVEALSCDEQELLDIVAVAGRPCQVSLVGHVLASEERKTAALLRGLAVRTRVLAMESDSVSFEHELLRRFVLDRMPPSLERQLHLRIGRAYRSALASSEAESTLATEHLVMAGDEALGMTEVLAAAEALTENRQFRRAIALLRQFAERPSLPVGERAVTLIALARVAERTGSANDQRQAAATAYRGARAAGAWDDACEALLLRAAANRALGRFQACSDDAQRAAELAGAHDLSEMSVRAGVFLAVGESVTGSPKRALELAESAETLAQESGLEALAFTARICRARIITDAFEPEEAVTLLTELESYPDGVPSHVLADAALCLAQCYDTMGEFVRAEAASRGALASAQAAGMRREEVLAMRILSHALSSMRPETECLLRRAARIARLMNNGEQADLCEDTLAFCRFDRGLGDEAMAHLTRRLASGELVPHWRAYLTGLLAEFAWYFGDLDRAAVGFQDLGAQAERLQVPDMQLMANVGALRVAQSRGRASETMEQAIEEGMARTCDRVRLEGALSICAAAGARGNGARALRHGAEILARRNITKHVRMMALVHCSPFDATYRAELEEMLRAHAALLPRTTALAAALCIWARTGARWAGAHALDAWQAISRGTSNVVLWPGMFPGAGELPPLQEEAQGLRRPCAP